MKNIYIFFCGIIILLVLSTLFIPTRDINVSLYPSKLLVGVHKINDSQRLLIKLENKGVSPIKKIDIKPSCSCSILYSSTDIVYSGNSIDLNFDYRYPLQPGNFQDFFYVDVYSDSNNFTRIKIPIEGELIKTYEIHPPIILREYDPKVKECITVFYIQAFDAPWSNDLKYELKSNNERKDVVQQIAWSGGGYYLSGCLTICSEKELEDFISIGVICVTVSKLSKQYHFSIPYKLYSFRANVEPQIITYNPINKYHFKFESSNNVKINKILLNEDIEIPFKEVMSLSSTKRETFISLDISDEMKLKTRSLSAINIYLSNGNKLNRHFIIQ